MPYMANVNRIISYIMIPILLVSYIFYIYIDHNNFQDYGRDEIIKTHLKQIRENNNIDSYILGGSNSYYSLSAKILSNKTKDKWYNASVLHEGFSIKNYQSFILEISSIKNKSKIKNVIYSSITPYRIGMFDKIMTIDNISINGQRDIGLKPQKYAFDYLTKKSKKEIINKNPTIYGDINFNHFSCNLKSKDMTRHRERIEKTIQFLTMQASFLAKTFPNASLFITLPSELYDTSTPDYNFNNSARSYFIKEWNNMPESKNRRVQLIIQPPFTNIDMICDGKHHANEKGRIWRTENLLTMMKQKT